MNLAISTILVLFLFIVPGLIFRRFYYSGEFSRQYFKEAPFHAILTSIIPGILGQTAFSFVINEIQMLPYKIDYQSTFEMLLGAENSESNPIISKTISNNIYQIAMYNITLWGLMGILGIVFKSLIRYCKLDRKMRIFRYQNEWHYIFRGELYDYPKLKKRKPKRKKLFWTEVDIMVSNGEGHYLYRGVLDEYVLNNTNNGLDRVYLSQVKKWIIKNDGSKIESSRSDIPGDFFLIPFEQIRNVNITYVNQSKNIGKTSPSKERLALLNVVFSFFLWGHIIFFRIAGLDDISNWLWAKISIQLFILMLLETIVDYNHLKNIKSNNASTNEIKKMKVELDTDLLALTISLISIILAYSIE